MPNRDLDNYLGDEFFLLLLLFKRVQKNNPTRLSYNPGKSCHMFVTFSVRKSFLKVFLYFLTNKGQNHLLIDFVKRVITNFPKLISLLPNQNAYLGN